MVLKLSLLDILLQDLLVTSWRAGSDPPEPLIQSGSSLGFPKSFWVMLVADHTLRTTTLPHFQVME